MENRTKIAVVFPCYRVKDYILGVLDDIPNMIDRIYIIDDACPQQSGDYVARHRTDERLTIIYHEDNQGVGGAVISGYRQAIKDDCKIVVKIDGDGQMNMEYLPDLLAPILTGQADYTKGNRFFQLEYLKEMPWLRLFGNSSLSLISKISSGYWNIMDPTNGYTAIHHASLRLLPLDKLHKRYFFESDLIFRLNIIRAVVQDIPMPARYADIQSNLNLIAILASFPFLHLTRFCKRFFYTYLLRDFNAGTILMISGTVLSLGGGLFGGYHWYQSIVTGQTASSGTVMLAALPLLTGIQLLISALNFDIANIPTDSLQKIMDHGKTFSKD